MYNNNQKIKQKFWGAAIWEKEGKVKLYIELYNKSELFFNENWEKRSLIIHQCNLKKNLQLHELRIETLNWVCYQEEITYCNSLIHH